MTTRKTVTFSAAALFAVAVQMAASGAGTIPGTDIQYDYILTAGDTSSTPSLTTGGASHWSDGNVGGYVIQAEDTDKVFYVPAGLTARATSETQTIVPIIYASGKIYPLTNAGKGTTFNDLRLLDGGSIYGGQVGYKAGNITILAEDPDNPVLFNFARDKGEHYKYFFNMRARLAGSRDSQLLYKSDGDKALLFLNTSSDWSDFYGTLRIEGDGIGITNRNNVSISMPGTVKFGNGGMLQLASDNAPYSFGNLSFSEDGTLSNTGNGSTLTVSGTFDTGTNLTWFCKRSGTFGTLILGDGLSLRNDLSSPENVLTVTNKLEVGRKITVAYTNVPDRNGATSAKVLFMRLAPEAVAAGVPDLSGVTVKFDNDWPVGYLTTEEDPENAGWLLVYATQDPIVYYNGPNEWDNNQSEKESWLDPIISPARWEDGLYPDGDKVYCVTQIVFASSKVTTFPGKTLVCAAAFYMTTSPYVTNLYLATGGYLYGRSNIHIRGNLTPIGTRRVRQLGYRTFYLDSTVHGSGSLYFNSYYPEQGKGGGTFYLTADNSDWTGSWYTTWTEQSGKPVPVDETNHTRIVVGDAKALGGNPKTFTYDAQKLTDYAELRFTNTTVQTAFNRGLGVGVGIVRVDEGATADLTAPVTLKGTLYKVGAGTLGFGGGIRWAENNDLTDTTAPAAGENVLLVKEGAIKCGSLAQAAVTFSDGAGIAADAASGAMDLTSATVTAEGAICLKADANTLPKPTEPVVYPVVKVSAEQNATLGTAFRAAKAWKGWFGTLVSETDGDGNVIYSVKYGKKGTVISIQ